MEQPPSLDDGNYELDNEPSPIMDQLDGNVSLLSCSDSCSDPLDTDSISNPIPVHTGYRPNSNIFNSRLPPVRRRIRRDNKVLQAASLPKISNYNMRSLMPKILNFGTDMEDRNCSISFLTEVWEKSENKKHQFKIQELG